MTSIPTDDNELAALLAAAGGEIQRQANGVPQLVVPAHSMGTKKICGHSLMPMTQIRSMYRHVDTMEDLLDWLRGTRAIPPA